MGSPKDAPSQPAEYRPELDGLRAFAVLAVLIHHLEPAWLPGGFLGVDVFFVLSGYVVARSQLRQPCGAGAFLARRVRRLQPALVLVVLSCGLLSGLASVLSGSALQTAIASLVGAGNLVLWQQSLDYFGSAAVLNPFTHTWSLGVEEQFYLLFPWLFPALRAGRPPILALGVALLLASLAAWWALLPGQPETAFFLMPMRLWELGLGTALQLLEWRGQRHGSPGLALAGLALACLCVTLPLRLQAISTPLTVLATLALIADGTRKGPVRGLLQLTPLRAIGLRSYAIYLWHWPLMVVLRQVLPWPPAISGGLAVTLSLGMSWWTYRCIEEPLRRGRWDPRRGLAASLAGGIALTGSWALLPANRSNPAEQLAQRENRLRQQRCHSPLVANPLNHCLPASQDDLPRLLLLGDSHAGQLRPILEHWRQRQSTPIPLLQLSDRALPNQWLGRPGCREAAYCYSNQDLFAAIDNALPAGSLVVWSFYSGRLNGPERSAAETRRGAEHLQQRLLQLARLLQRTDRQLLLVSDVPRLACPETIPFAAAYNRGGIERTDALCGLSEASALQLRLPLQQAYILVSRTAGNVSLVDGHARFCQGGRCTLMNEHKQPLVWDQLSHLTGRGLTQLAPTLEAALTRWLLRKPQSHQRQGR